MKRMIILLLLPLFFGCSKNIELEEVFNENVTVEEVEKDPIEEDLIQTRSPIALKDLYGRKIRLRQSRSKQLLAGTDKGGIDIVDRYSNINSTRWILKQNGFPQECLVKAENPNSGYYLRANGFYPNLTPQISIFNNQNFYLKEVPNSDYYLIVAKVTDMNNPMLPLIKEVYLHCYHGGTPVYMEVRDYVDERYSYWEVEVL